MTTSPFGTPATVTTTPTFLPDSRFQVTTLRPGFVTLYDSVTLTTGQAGIVAHGILTRSPVGIAVPLSAAILRDLGRSMTPDQRQHLGRILTDVVVELVTPAVEFHPVDARRGLEPAR